MERVVLGEEDEALPAEEEVAQVLQARRLRVDELDPLPALKGLRRAEGEDLIADLLRPVGAAAMHAASGRATSTARACAP